MLSHIVLLYHFAAQNPLPTLFSFCNNSLSVCGSIGFVGLVVPHMVRRLVTKEPGDILIPSALMGGLLLTLADMLTRLPTPGATLQLGVVTSLIGAPTFLYIIYKTRKGMR